MNLNIFARNKITFYTIENFKLHPSPYPAYKKFPEWYGDNFVGNSSSRCPFKNLFSDKIEIDRRISGCPGITDYLKTGYIIPAWTDFVFRNVDDKLIINWGNSNGIFYSSVDEDQFPNMPEEKKPMYGSFHKINTPWIIKTSPGTSCLVLHPEWDRNNFWKSSSGVLHTDVKPVNMNWFFEWNKEISKNKFDEKTQVIRHGTPLMLIVPFKRTQYQSEVIYKNFETIKCMEDQQKEFLSNKLYAPSLYNNFRKTIKNLFL